MTPKPLGIALDTNILLDITRLKLQVIDQLLELAGSLPLVIPIQVKHELQALSLERDKTGTAARVALDVLSQNHIKVVPAEGATGDDALHELAQKGYIVATNDRLLKQTLKKAPQRVIVVRQSKYLDWQ
ncbi:MAG: PIN domain-containing protein [archaeon]